MSLGNVTVIHISHEKSKTKKTSEKHQPISLEKTEPKYVDKFTYVGSTKAKDGDVETDVNMRLAKAAAVFRRLNSVRKFCSLSIKLKLQLYSAVVVSTAI